MGTIRSDALCLYQTNMHCVYPLVFMRLTYPRTNGSSGQLSTDGGGGQGCLPLQTSKRKQAIGKCYNMVFLKTYTFFLLPFSGQASTGCPEKTDTIIFCYNSENKQSTFKNGTCLYSQEHGKPDDRCHMACTPPGQSRQLFKADARCEARTLNAHLVRKKRPDYTT